MCVSLRRGVCVCMCLYGVCVRTCLYVSMCVCKCAYICTQGNRLERAIEFARNGGERARAHTHTHTHTHTHSLTHSLTHTHVGAREGKTYREMDECRRERHMNHAPTNHAPIRSSLLPPSLPPSLFPRRPAINGHTR